MSNLNSAERRLRKEIYDLHKQNASGDRKNMTFSIGPEDDNIFHWKGIIIGPEESPYEGGVFDIDIHFPKQFPFKPPSIRFLTYIYHPNIDINGNICLDILNENWNPVLTVSKLVMSISSLLTDPNPEDPLFIEAANLYKADKNSFEKEAREWTILYAMGT